MNLDNILPVSVTPQARKLLERLAASGIYGRDAADVAARFIDEALQGVTDPDDM